jgi:GDPmannose 4,6-dehydratase
VKRALITGITGQDGSYLAEFLIQKNYDVQGIVRRSSSSNTGRLTHFNRNIHDPEIRLTLHHGDMLDSGSLRRILFEVRPDEVYNLAAQSHVKISYEQPEYTADVVAGGALRLLEAVRDYVDSGRQVRLYQASSSEMFGSAPPPQREDTTFHPRSPYAVSKLAAHWQCVNYREAYGIFVCNGILFNHESPLRGEAFVTRKITRGLARIKYGHQDYLYLGNLEARRDWGFAGDYVEAMWLMLQGETPDDFVVATGESYSVRDFLDEAARHLGMDWERHVKTDERYMRPAEVDFLQGDSTKARRQLGWKPKVSFRELVGMMVSHDTELARQECTLKEAGHKVDATGEFCTRENV